MSLFFTRVKAKMQKEIDSITQHTPESWADIMLRYSSLLITDEDQESFFNWILNPSDNLNFVPPHYKTIVPTEEVQIQTRQTVTVIDEGDEKNSEEEVELQVETRRNGLTEYITVTPLTTCKSLE
jgi:hypothetical protein